MEKSELRAALESQRYIFDEKFLVTLYVAIELGRPLLIEGAAGVGKTEVAKALAAALDTDLIRLQCYEGLDETKALYEWNYQKQLLTIQINMLGDKDKAGASEIAKSLFSEEFLLERPLLKSIRTEKRVVLLIDEIDKSDEEFEAFLLELLSDFQVSIPEIGTIKAKTRPIVLLTSNNTRPLSEALKRRCAYMYIDYPTIEKEVSIIMARMPGANERLAADVAAAAYELRHNERVIKKPSVAESLDWVAALNALGQKRLTEKNIDTTIGFALKNHDDIELLNEDNALKKAMLSNHSDIQER